MANLPTFVKTWDWSFINQRITYSSLNATMAAFLYGIKNYLVGTMGASVVYTCDGTTGPTSSSDHTDRWASAANCTTRGANAGAAQSFAVLSWAGVQFLLAYQGASDDIALMAFSQGSLYTPAATANQQPTASDSTPVVSASSLISATTSADRVYSVVATTDKTVARWALYRANTLISYMGIEKVSEAPGITVGTVVCYAKANGYATYGGGQGEVGGTAASAGTINCAACRQGGANISLPEVSVGSANLAMPSANPVLNSGAMVFPIMYGSSTTSDDGFVGTRYDAFWAAYNTPSQGQTLDDVVQSERVVVWGEILQPWLNSAGVTTA